MVRIYSPSTSHSSSSDERLYPSQQFGGPVFHEPMLPPPPETAAPHSDLDYHNHSPPRPPPPYRRSHHHSDQFGRPASGEPMVSLLPAHDSAAPHLFMNRNRSPPPPPPFYGHDHGYPQQLGSPPPLGHHHPPPPAHSYGHPQQFGSPASQEPMLFPPPAHESGAPFHGYPQQFDSLPPPPPPPSLGHPRQFGRSSIHKPIPSPRLAHESGAPHLFISHNHSPPPPSHGHHHPPPPSHGHSHGHHSSQQFDRPAFHKGMPSPPPDLEPAAPHMFMSGTHSPPPPPRLDCYNQPHSPLSSPHSHGGALHHPCEIGRHPAFEIEAPHLFMNHLHRSHSLPPPPHSHHSHSHSPPSHGFEHDAAKFRVQPPMEGPEEGLHRYEPFPSGKGLHPSNQFSGHLEGMSNWLPSEEHYSPPHHHMGGGYHDYFKLRPGHSYMPDQMAGVAHHGRHSPPHPRSPPPKHRGRPGAPPSYPPFCAPLVPAAHLSNGHRLHLAVPVW